MGNFGDLVNIEEFGEKRKVFDPERGEISFYCKNCNKIVETNRLNAKGYTFTCTICKGKNIAIGTEKGLKENYERKKF